MKTTLLRILKWVAIILALAVVGIQFVRPARTNPPLEPSLTLEAHTQMTPEVAKIFERSCNDCHSLRSFSMRCLAAATVEVEPMRRAILLRRARGRNRHA
jgi:hypothetical protein